MSIWIFIMWTALSLTGAALVYVSNRICKFECIRRLTKDSEKRKAAIGGGIVFGGFVIIGLLINFMNAIVCIIYFALSWIICDSIAYVWQKISGHKFKHYYAGGAALLLALSALTVGWYCNHHVWSTEYNLSTDKDINDLKIVMFADSHIGTTFNADGFAEHIAAMQSENPDIVVIAGDFVDDGTTRQDMIEACRILGKMQTTYGVYFVFGNHDSGYYGPQYRGFSGADLVAELKKNGIKVLHDTSANIANNIYIIGRRDFSVEKEQGGRRKSMADFVKDFDEKHYLIVADHQPADFKNQASAKVDLVLSGHTHGGQLWPFNQVGKWIGANDRVYGHEKRNVTDFIVTSGLSDWSIKFKTGTKSEYVVVNLNPKTKKLPD